MPIYKTTIGHGGVLELPKELRERLGIKEGTPVEFFLTRDGQVYFHAICGTTEGFGGIAKVAKRNPPISVREMDDGIADHLAAEDERISGRSDEIRAKKLQKKSAAE